MAWEIDRYGVARYVQKVRIDGRVTSKVLGVGEDGLAAEKQVLFEREAKRLRRIEEREFRANLGIYQQTVRQITSKLSLAKALFIATQRGDEYRNSRNLSPPKNALTQSESNGCLGSQEQMLFLTPNFRCYKFQLSRTRTQI
jgi:hypothetical protein